MATATALRPRLLTSTTITIRASSLTGYADCQLRAVAHSMPALFEEHGHEMAPPRGNIGALIGTGTHGAGEAGHTELMQRGIVPPLSVLEDAGIEAFRERFREEREVSLEIIMDGEAPDANAAERQVRRMVAAYRTGVMMHANPIAVESRINAELRPGVILSGQADLLTLEELESGERVVADLKTSRRPQAAAKHAPQTGCYSLLFRSRGHETSSTRIDGIKRVALAKPQPPVEQQWFPVEQAERIAWATITDFADKAEAFVADGDPSRLLTNPSSLLCNPKFCRLYGKAACPSTGGTK